MSTKKIDSFSGEFFFLSNFYPSDITHNGIVYPSVENAYQASKATCFEDAIKFVDLTPGQAKRLGKKILLRPDWETVKISVMRELIFIKFFNTLLQPLLLDTEDFKLIEGNNWGDTFWGVCEGKGQNNLGKLLMDARDIIISNQPNY